MAFSAEELAANARLKEDAESCGGTGSPYGYGQEFRGWLNKDLLTLTNAVLREAERGVAEDSLRGYAACEMCGEKHNPYMMCSQAKEQR